jgi:hypothetical protein
MNYRNIFALGALTSIAALTLACSSSSSGNGGGSSGGDGGGGGSGGSLSFKPSNVDLSGIDTTGADDVILSGTNCPIDSEAADGPMFLLCSQDANNRVVHKIVTLPDQSRLSVFVMKSLRIEASTVLLVNRGHLPVVLVALNTMELLGSIEVAPGTTGGPFNATKYANGVGMGGGTAGDSSGLAGGGASYCGLGGKGGTNSAEMGAPPVAPTPAYGTPELVPLLPGSAGGNGALTNNGGNGGGALQLVAGTSFTLHSAGYINVGGDGGIFGGEGKDGAGGGGSGGALLIESPTVTIDGKLAANGGGGGQGNGDSGEPGHPDKIAQGGHKMGVGAPAGNGSFGTALNGTDGPTSADTLASGGSGGGGAGRIRINTTAAAASITGAASPAVGTACLTQGKLGS